MTRRRLCLALAAVLALAELARVLRAFGLHPPHALAWDYTVLCDAATVLRQGNDPYITANLPHHFLSYPYLPTIAWIFAPLCALSPQGAPLVGAIQLAVLVASALALGRGLGLPWREAALLGLAAPGAFDAGTWIVLTGNAAILEAPLMAAALVALHRQRNAAGGAALGVLASIKMLPLAWLLAFPLLWQPGRAWRPVAAGLAAFAAMLAFGLLLAGPLRAHLGAMLLGEIPNQHAPFHEALQRSSDPNLPDFLFQLSSVAGLAHRGPPTTALALLFLATGTALARWRNTRTLAPLCIALLVIALALFRLKPYAYTSLTLLALAACVEAGRLHPERLLAVVASIAAARLLVFAPVLGPVVSDYYQLVAVLGATAALAVLMARNPQLASGGQGAALDPPKGKPFGNP